jgi:hypothetical protein
MDAPGRRIFHVEDLFGELAGARCEAGLALREGLSGGLGFDWLGVHIARGSDGGDVVGNGYGLGGGFGWRLPHWFEVWRALAKLDGRHGIDAVGGRGILWLVLHFNLLGWRRCGSHSRIRRDNSYRLRNDRQSGSGSFVDFGGLSFCDVGPLELLDGLCGGGSNGSVIAEVGTVVSPALAAVVAVVAVGAAITSRLPLKVARRPVASLTRVGTRVVA